MFEPLSFDEIKHENVDICYETPCLLCDDKFNLKLCFPIFVRHIFEVHHLVIEDAQNIDNLNEYLSYWKHKFTEIPMERIVPVVSVAATESKYFVLSTLSKEDKELRHKLKLECMLKIQQFERTDGKFAKPCLFCKLNFEGMRYDYLLHLKDDHNLHLGNPNNLVYIDELFDKIKEKFDNLQCLYCEKTFPDRNTLKEHMRKKQHKRINSSKQAYDKFFSVNYLDPDRNWSNLDKVDVSPNLEEQQINDDEEYACWNEEEASIICLFCSVKDTDINKLCLHMSNKHHFDFYAIRSKLDFYEKVKLVNYIRRQIHRLHCINCDVDFQDVPSLHAHMETEDHYCLPDSKMYNQFEFYFSTYENDTLVWYFLEEIEDEEEYNPHQV